MFKSEEGFGVRGSRIGRVLKKIGRWNMFPAAGIGYSIVGLIVLVVIFFICRSLILWYWKIDKIEQHLAAIRSELEKRN